MKHYVLGFVFNVTEENVLLIKKKRPQWQAGHWNGFGGKIEQDDNNPLAAINREAREETGCVFCFYHVLTFVCLGGTVFVYKATSRNKDIVFKQLEDEELKTWPLNGLPENMMSNLKWIIPVCLSTIQFPLMVQQNTLGV